jgi:hypothetical protein
VTTLDNMTSQERKDRPMARGVLEYFPDALAEVAYVSMVGNEKHNPGQPFIGVKVKVMTTLIVLSVILLVAASGTPLKFRERLIGFVIVLMLLGALSLTFR